MGKAARFDGLFPSSPRSSSAAAGASRKTGTRPEIVLSKALWRRGFRYQKNRRDLPGIPDLVFPRARLVVFVDGDFWHGKQWKTRKAKLMKGHNATYWIKKIAGNRSRDAKHNRELLAMGWSVLRIWESDIRDSTTKAVHLIEETLRSWLLAHPMKR